MMRHLGLLPLPEGAYPQDPPPLHGIVGLDVDRKEVRAAHALVHGELGRDFGLLPRGQGRRTDDRLRGSATLDGFDLWIHDQTERLIPDVPQAEAGINHPLEADRPEVNQLLVHQEARSPGVLISEADRDGSLQEEPGGNGHDHCQADRPRN